MLGFYRRRQIEKRKRQLELQRAAQRPKAITRIYHGPQPHPMSDDPPSQGRSFSDKV
jgi:hypothetical protein